MSETTRRGFLQGLGALVAGLAVPAKSYFVFGSGLWTPPTDIYRFEPIMGKFLYAELAITPSGFRLKDPDAFWASWGEIVDPWPLGRLCARVVGERKEPEVWDLEHHEPHGYRVTRVTPGVPLDETRGLMDSGAHYVLTAPPESLVSHL